jgi:hypothetical protein
MSERSSAPRSAGSAICYKAKMDAMALVSSPLAYVSVVTVRSTSPGPNLSVEPAGWTWAMISSLPPRAIGASCSMVTRIGPRSSSGVADR